MSSDDEIKAQMKITAENPRKAVQKQQKVEPDKAKVEELTAKAGKKVWVKCVTELQPWANEAPMLYWKDYLVSVEEAVLLDERRFVVILEKPSDKGE